MNEPEEDEERAAPAQLAATSRAKIYLGNVQSAMEAGAWKRALTSCEELMHALQKVVYG